MSTGDQPTQRIGPVTRRLPPTGPDEVLDGRYRLDGLIGSGRTADVYRAVDLRLGRPVAVKIFRSGPDAAGGRRLREEVSALPRHPGLVAVHDIATDGARPYLVTELVDGPTLRQELRRGPFEAAEVTRIGTELAQVLAAVHERGLVHGDLTASNVLMEQDGHVRLTDTGIGDPVGAGPAADVEALALVLLEALTGHPPQGRPPAVPRGTPSPLREALHAMTATDPARRPTAREVAGLLAGRSATEPASLGNGRRGAIIAIGVAALLAVLIGLVLAVGSAGRDSPVAAPTTTAPTARSTAAPRTTAPGIALPSIPTALPDLPDLPTALPDLPTALPTIPPDIKDDAKSLWDRIKDWWSSLTG